MKSFPDLETFSISVLGSPAKDIEKILNLETFPDLEKFRDLETFSISVLGSPTKDLEKILNLETFPDLEKFLDLETLPNWPNVGDLSSWQDKSPSQKGWVSIDRSVVAALPSTTPRPVHKSSTDDLGHPLCQVGLWEMERTLTVQTKIP